MNYPRTLKAACLIAALLLGDCTFIQPPAVNLPAKETVTPGETITIKGNPNVYTIARQYHVSMRELIVLNDIKPPFNLHPGQTLVLPANKTDGDNAGMAFGTNGGTSMPGVGPSTQGNFSYTPPGSGGGPAAPAPIAAPNGAIESTTLPPVEQQALPPPTMAPQTLPPVSSGSPQPAIAPGSPAPQPLAQAGTQVDRLNAPSVAAKPLTTTVQSAEAPAADLKTTAIAGGAAAPAADFAWPVQGPVLSAYGPKGQGLSNDGVNIGAPKGAPVVAAGNGIVVYAGNEMKGFGNLILIRHQGGWVTAYAHLDRALVTKDAVVAKGDMIGTVGKTGNVPSPQLHFETRLNGKPVDPSSLIKSNPT